MVLANSRFEIDVTEQRPRPLIPTPHPPPPPKRKTTESHHDFAGQRLFQRPARAVQDSLRSHPRASADFDIGDVVSSVGAALGLIAAWLYVVGWAYAYAYFDRFRIPLLLVDIPFQHMLVHGGLILLKNLRLSMLITMLFIAALWGLSRRSLQLGRILVSTIIVVGMFGLAHAGGIGTAIDDFRAERDSDYEAYPRLRLLLKNDMMEAREALGDTATIAVVSWPQRRTDCFSSAPRAMRSVQTLIHM